MSYSMRVCAMAALMLIGVSSTCYRAAAISYTGTTYTQDFDSLANSGATVAWTNDSTLAGWSLFNLPAAPAPFAT
jgi:hypothetical protein